MNSFTLSTYDAQWPALFDVFKQKLTKIFGDNLTAIYHIGSTAVEGLSAKPVIDIMPTVFSLSKVDELKSEFEREGFQWRGEFGIFGRRYLTLEENGISFCHVHIFEASDLAVEKHLALRDLLRSDRDKLSEYEQLKKKLFSEFSKDKNSYQSGKSDFINETALMAVAKQNRFRIPTQVYVWIVCTKKQEPKYLLLKRSVKAGGFWQAVTGAPFSDEEIEVAALRELFEETRISPKENAIPLDFSYCFPLSGEWKKSYRNEVEKIVEKVFYTFVDDFIEPHLSDEHEQFRWCNYYESLELLKWPSNKESLQVLHNQLSAKS